MHRLLVARSELERDRPELDAAARHHLKVLRLKLGEQVELFDGAGAARTYASEAGGGLVAVGEPRQYALPRPLTLFACVTKLVRWEWTLEKATELGVTRIVPVLSERSVVRLKSGERADKAERWRRIVEEAARQSDAKFLPEVKEGVDFAAAVALAAECDTFVGALTVPPPPTLGEVLRRRGDAAPRGAGYAIFVGPEGDFTPAELEALVAVATPVSFGSTILRAETAAIYGLSVLKSVNDARAGE